MSTATPTELDRTTARNLAVERHLPLAVAVARRYRGRGVPMNDLVQVASIGLIRAVDRYDATRGVRFATYAVPTIAGEIKRHFRDQGWHIRLPRSLQSQALRVMQARRELSHTLARTPTPADLAAHLGTDEKAVRAALDLLGAYRALSLDAPVGRGCDVELEALVNPGPDPAFDAAEARAWVRRLLVSLPMRERRVIWLRFYEDLTQDEIADAVGLSQTAVSRSLARSLARLKVLATEAGPAVTRPGLSRAGPGRRSSRARGRRPPEGRRRG